MSEKAFQIVEAKIKAMYAEGAYSQIIDYIDQVYDRFPDEYLYLVYWQIGMAARLKRPQLVYALMDDLLGRDLWISADLLHISPSMESMQGLVEYEIRVDRFQKLQEAEFVRMLPVLMLRRPGEGENPKAPAPLLIGLHDDRQRAMDAALLWGSAAHKGWLVGVPQSSQALWTNAYVWDNREVAYAEIGKRIDSIRQNYAVDSRKIIFSGVGVGGEIAAWLLTAGGLDGRGFVAINPDGPLIREPDQWMGLLQSRNLNLRGAVLLDSTHPAQDQVERAVEVFNVFGIHVRLYRLDNPVDPHEVEYLSAFLTALDDVMD